MTAVKSPAAGPAGALSAMAGDVVSRTLLFSALWWILLSGDNESWVLGVFAIPLAVWCSLRLFPGIEPARPGLEPSRAPGAANEARIQAMALPRFALFFLWQSLTGGCESARFALGPKAALKPGFLRFTLQLPEGKSRLYFLQLVNLLPGTVSVALEGDELLIHALDREADNHGIVASCEARIGALLNVPIVYSADDQVKRQ